MKLKQRKSGLEPGISQQAELSGMEPSVKHHVDLIYGHFRVRGLEAPEVPGRRRPLVVLAHVDRELADLMGIIADSNGYSVKLTPSGEEAWRLVQALEPDLLVAGRRLVGMDGLTLVRRVRQDRNWLIAQMRILVINNVDQVDNILKVFWAGANDCCLLPVVVPTFLQDWQRILEKTWYPYSLAALLNEDDLIRDVALSHLLNHHPAGLSRGLNELLLAQDAHVRQLAEWALQRLGSSNV